MSLRTRLTALVAVAVALAVSVAAAVDYGTTRAELRRQVDQTLLAQARELAHGPLPAELPAVAPLETGVALFPGVWFLGPDGQVAGSLGGRTAVPVTEDDRAVARGERPQALRDADVAGVHLRIATVARPEGGAVLLTRPLTEVDRTLDRLGLLLVLAALGGVALSVAAGFVVARAGLAPVDRLTAAAEHVARTQDLRASIDVHGHDEVARLARSVNAMLSALDRSRERQRQLVADAGHELRTPLTSLRTNLELLARSEAESGRALDPVDRAALLRDVTAQLAELTTLVGDVVSLARDDEARDEPVEVALDELVARAVDRVRLRAPGVRFDLDLRPYRLRGVPARLERAVTNVLDNAAKWSPADGVVEVRLAPDGVLTVRDHGPGIADEDLPFVFERFYRAGSARSMPGSGLGLAIVREAVEAHGGTVSAGRHPDGGTVLRLRLPASGAPGPQR